MPVNGDGSRTFASCERSTRAERSSPAKNFSAERDAFNEKAEGASFPHCFGLWCWNPKYLETSVSV